MPFLFRPLFGWQLRTRTLTLGGRTLLMGILNVTPDSFSDGGRWFDTRAAYARALEMLDEGADLLDVGAESTRPGAAAIAPVEEQARLLPVLEAILAARPAAIISVDTHHAETAKLAVEAGAEIVNDVSGGLWDREMAATCAGLRCGMVLMHTRGRPQDWHELPALHEEELMPIVMGELGERAREAMARGVSREAIVLDPGFGFGKGLGENFPLLAHFGDLRELEFPLLAGVSRKGFLRQALGKQNDGNKGRRLEDATTAACTAAILSGAHILRIHEIGPVLAAAAIADRVLEAL